jgi:hypothetical protein
VKRIARRDARWESPGLKARAPPTASKSLLLAWPRPPTEAEVGDPAGVVLQEVAPGIFEGWVERDDAVRGVEGQADRRGVGRRRGVLRREAALEDRLEGEAALAWGEIGFGERAGVAADVGRDLGLRKQALDRLRLDQTQVALQGKLLG